LAFHSAPFVEGYLRFPYLLNFGSLNFKEGENLRIISGIAKGRRLKAVPGTSTRPTADKVKEAVFSMIGPYFDGGMALDLFAGTGALGIEALSRGMDRAIFVDVDKKCTEIIRHNLQIAGLEKQAEVYRNDAARAVKALGKKDLRFDLVFIDPPYRLPIVEDLLLLLERTGITCRDTTIVVEQDANRTLPESIGLLQRVRRSVYGDTSITIYKGS